MIGFLNGKIFSINHQEVLLDVNGVGYSVFVPLKYSSVWKKWEQVFLYTYVKIKDDAHELYGFPSLEVKNFFLLITSISGVGPKIGLQALEFPIDLLKNAIEKEDIAVLTQVPGLGKKTASRMILELRGKIPSLSSEENSFESPAYIEVFSVLENLGYKKTDLQNLFEKYQDEVSELSSSEDIIRWALKKL